MTAIPKSPSNSCQILNTSLVPYKLCKCGLEILFYTKLNQELLQQLDEHMVVILLSPREGGKTTLAQYPKKSIVDESQQAGQIVLTGSHSLELRVAITQSLAGRTGILHLLPFLLNSFLAYSTKISDRVLSTQVITKPL